MNTNGEIVTFSLKLATFTNKGNPIEEVKEVSLLEIKTVDKELSELKSSEGNL